MSEERFMTLVAENEGFEFCQACREDVDHILGGKGDTCWYIIMKKGKVRETYIGKCTDGVWEDVFIKGSGEKKRTKAMPSGTTISMISEKAYLMQDESWVTRRTPAPTEEEHPRYHYMYGFGEKGLDVSVQYGVTVFYSDINDPDSGFHLRYIYTGSNVELP